MMYITFSELIYLVTRSLYPLTNTSPFFPPSQSLATTDLLCFYEYPQIPHISEIIQYLSFSVWYILLSVIHSRPIHIVTNVRISFCFMAEQQSIVCIYNIFFIYSPVDGHVSCFYVLVIVSSAAVNIVGCAYISLKQISFPVYIYPEVGLLGHMEVIFLIFCGTFILL